MSHNKYWVEFERGLKEHRAHLPWEWRSHFFFIKRFLGRLINGYHKSDIWDLDKTLTAFIPDKVEAYTIWQCEHGKHLPDKFKADPAAWTEILRKIERAWVIIRDVYFEEDEGLIKEVEEGMALFGRYFNELHG